MPQPSPSDVHVDGPLTNISTAFLQDNNTVSDKMFPIVSVQKQSDSYYTYTKDYWTRIEAKKRAPGTESAGGGFELSTATYFSDVYAIHMDVDNQTLANADAALNIDRDAAMWCSRQLAMKREKDWATNYFTTSVWSSDVTPGTLWSAASSTPIEDIRDEATTIQKNTGYRPNRFCPGREVHDKLVDHADVLDRIKYTQRGIVDTELLAALFEVETYIIGDMMETTSAEGATVVDAFVFGKDALLVYSPDSPGLLTPTGGYTFSWQGMNAMAGPQGNAVSRMDVPLRKAERIEAEMSWDHKVVSSSLGTFFSAVVA
jgi:hypothetical protein